MSAQSRPERPWRLFATLVAGVALAGALGFTLGEGTRPAVSYLAGLGIASAIATLGVVLVSVAAALAPNLAMLVALANYVMTVVVFLLLLRTIGSQTVDVPAFATGLAASVVPYLAWQFRLARPRP